MTGQEECIECHGYYSPDNCVVHLLPRRFIMIKAVRNCFLVFFCSLVSIPGGIAFAQGNSGFENARQLNKQEIIDLIANKTVRYRITVGSQTESDVNVEMNKITFTKTEEFGGNLSAFSTKSSTDGKWYVNDKSRLVRQYDRVAWGNKPFGVGVFENKGKYYWKIGEVFQELLSID